MGVQFTLRYVSSFRLTALSVEFPFDPVFTEELNWVLSSNSSVSAAKVIGGAQLLTTPAKTLWVFGIHGYSGLTHGTQAPVWARILILDTT
jgi:hypothetical protein